MPSNENLLQQTPQQSENEVLESGELLLKPESNTSPENQQSNTALTPEEQQQTKLNQLEKEPIKENSHTIQQNSEKQHSDAQGSSDEDIPLQELRKKIQCCKRRRKQNVQISLYGDDDDDKEGNTSSASNFDANYAPSSESSSCSGDYQTPVIEKRKRKWVRERIRPLN